MREPSVCEAPVGPEFVCDDIGTLSHVLLHLGDDGVVRTVLDPDKLPELLLYIVMPNIQIVWRACRRPL